MKRYFSIVLVCLFIPLIANAEGMENCGNTVVIDDDDVSGSSYYCDTGALYDNSDDGFSSDPDVVYRLNVQTGWSDFEIKVEGGYNTEIFTPTVRLVDSTCSYLIASDMYGCTCFDDDCCDTPPWGGNSYCSCIWLDHLDPGTYYIWVEGGNPWDDCNYCLRVDATVNQPTSTATPEPGEGNDCSDPLSLDCGDCVTGSTSLFSDDHTCDFYFGLPGHDVVYEFALSVESQVNVISEAAFYNAAWGITDVCNSQPDHFVCTKMGNGSHEDASCGDIDPPFSSWSYLNWSGTLESGTYYIWIDSTCEASHGNYALELICTTPTPTATITPTPTNTGTPTATPKPEGDNCSNPYSIAMNSQETGSLSDFTRDFAPSCSPFTNIDSVYELVLNQNYEDVYICLSANFDSILAVMASDCTTELYCNDNGECGTSVSCAYSNMNDSALGPLSLSAGTYYIIVDSGMLIFNYDYCLDVWGTASGPTITPSPTPSSTATPEPTGMPTDSPTPSATAEPTGTPTTGPSPLPSETPTTGPSPEPTGTPTTGPSPEPTETIAASTPSPTPVPQLPASGPIGCFLMLFTLAMLVRTQRHHR